MTIRQRIRDRFRPSSGFAVPDTPDVPYVAHYTHPDVRAALVGAAQEPGPGEDPRCR